jgi:hypothetical protein
MGEAKRRREAGERISWCRACTLCCTVPEILSLNKPMYKRCAHLAGQGCGIFGKSERPAVCISFRCAYLAAREDNSADRHAIPHPLEAGAYFVRDPAEKVFVVFVDPARPEIWKKSAIVDYLRPWFARGFAVEVIDRGRRMMINSAALFEQVLKLDYVAYADNEGRPRDFQSYEEYEAGYR